MQDEKVEINSQLIRMTKKRKKKSFKKKIIINFFMMFFHAGVLSFEKQKMAHKAHVYKLILVF